MGNIALYLVLYSSQDAILLAADCGKGTTEQRLDPGPLSLAAMNSMG